MMGGASRNEMSCTRVCFAVQGGMLRRGEALSNASASPSNCVGVRVGESMRVSDAMA